MTNEQVLADAKVELKRVEAVAPVVALDVAAAREAVVAAQKAVDEAKA